MAVRGTARAVVTIALDSPVSSARRAVLHRHLNVLRLPPRYTEWVGFDFEHFVANFSEVHGVELCTFIRLFVCSMCACPTPSDCERPFFLLLHAALQLDGAERTHSDVGPSGAVCDSDPPMTVMSMVTLCRQLDSGSGGGGECWRHPRRRPGDPARQAGNARQAQAGGGLRI